MKYDTVYGLFTAICNAIRQKKGTTGMISHQDIPDEILSIETGGGEIGEDGLIVTNKYVDLYTLGKTNIDSGLEEDSKKYLIDATNMHKNNIYAGDVYGDLNGKTIRFYSLQNAFYKSKYFNNPSWPIDVSKWDVSNVKYMSNCFRDCESMNKLDISSWDTKNTLDMSFMFFGCGNLKELNVKNLDVSNVVSMESMFEDCNSLTTLDLSGWNTSNVQNMTDMFFSCKGLKELDVGHLDFSNVKSIGGAFSYLTSCTKLRLPDLPKTNYSSLASNSMLYDFQFSGNGTFGREYVSSLIFNITAIWRQTQDTVVSETGLTYGHYYEAFANSIGENTSGKTRTIKLHTTLYNSLSDEQKSLLIDKGYTLTYGTS